MRAGAAVPGCATRIARWYGSAGVVRSAESRQSKLGHSHQCGYKQWRLVCQVGPSSVCVAGAGCGPVFYTPIFMSSLVTTKPRVQARAKLFHTHPGSVMGSCSCGRQPMGARPGRRGRRRTNQGPSWRRGAGRGCSAVRACGGDVRGLLNKPISGRRRAFTRLTLLGKWVQQIEPCKRFGLAGGGGAALQPIEHSPHSVTKVEEPGTDVGGGVRPQ